MVPKLNNIVLYCQVSYFIFFVLVSGSVMGQAKQKKQLTSADYHLWSTLENPAVSSSGLWVSYSVRHASGNDTLFVRRNDGKKIFAYPKGENGKFFGEKWYACSNGKDISLTNLKNGKPEVFKDVHNFEFSGNGKYLFLFSKAGDDTKTLSVRNLLNGTVETTEKITCYGFNRERTKLAYFTQNDLDGEATVISVQNTIENKVQLPFTGAVATNVVWQHNSSSLVYVLQSVNESGKLDIATTKLAQFRFSDEQLLLLDPIHTKGFSKGKHIEAHDAERLKISDDGKRIFFQQVNDTLANSFNNPLVEVWHGDDKMLYSEQKQYGDFKDWEKTAVWYPDSSEVFEFMPDETHVMLSGNQQFALTSSLEPCELQFKYSPDRDFYLTNLTTRERQLWMKCHSPAMHHTIMSPTGKYIAYFKDGNWYSYTISTGEYKNLTNALGFAVYDEANDIGDDSDAYGFAGWTANDKSIIIYDKFDVWEVATNGAGAKRLTRGREQHICFRIINTTSAKKEVFMGVYDSDVIDLDSQLVLKASYTDESMQGYYILEHGKEKPLQFSPHHIYDLKKAADAAVFIFLQEDYEHPTSLQMNNLINTRTVFKSNPQQDRYRWGKVTTIHYIGATGAPLKGLLYYPFDYKKGTIYPMIVRVYQKQSDQIHYYRNPCNPVYDGFSIINFVTQGYFVLLPDIDYIMGSPSDSAVVCATAAVNTVLLQGNVDPQKVGLIGHSFGGYETSYIITKNSLFATAVAGASLTDLVSEYLTVSENYKKAEIWRYEYYTNRMIKPLFDNFEGYLHNSPVYNAPTIQTPLLLWTGEKDRHVAATQSMELYLAMRRLGKKVTMLRYPKEDHSLENPAAQSDLVNKVMVWFDYYLKGIPIPEGTGL